MKPIKIITLILTIAVLNGCAVTIPDSDTIPPNFSFRIYGDGFDRTFNQDFDFSRSQLNLRQGARYNFVYTGKDDGGTKLIQWQLSKDDVIRNITGIEAPWTIRDVTALSRMIQWSGTASRPVTGSVIAGTFVVRNTTGNDSFTETFRFFISDFGGRPRVSNSVSKELSILIANHTTALIAL